MAVAACSSAPCSCSFASAVHPPARLVCAAAGGRSGGGARFAAAASWGRGETRLRAAGNPNESNGKAPSPTNSRAPAVTATLALPPASPAAAACALLAAAHIAAPFALAAALPATPAAVVAAGLLAAGHLRVAGLLTFVLHGAAVRELATWRYQRANLAAGASCALAAAALLPSAAAAPPAAAAGLAALLGATAAASAALYAASARSPGGIAFASTLAVARGPRAVASELASYALRDAGTLAGVLCTLTLVIGLVGGLAVLLGPSPAASAAGGAAFDALRRPAGALCLLSLVAASLSLTEFAGRVARLPLLEAVKGALVDALAEGAPEPGARRAPRRAFLGLNACHLAAAAAQLWCITQAPAAGLDVNGDAALWAAATWSALAVGVYGLAVAADIDFSSLWTAVWRAGSFAAGALWLASTGLFFSREWTDAWQGER